MNPRRSDTAEKLMPVVLAVVTHLPNQEGYHKGRMEVIQTCLRSMTQNCRADYTLAIWDNGSIPELRDWMRSELHPDLLIESKNYGKTTARTCLSRMLPNKAIVCYSDDDMLYYPDWLLPQVELLKHFPKVAAVTGYPVRTAFRWGIKNTLAWARENGELEAGKFIPESWERDFAASIGRDWETHRNGTAADVDYRTTYKGMTAYCTAHHCQFIGYAGIVGMAMQYDGLAMGDEKPFDERLDELGLRLATTKRLTRHIGNVIDDNLRAEIKKVSQT